MVSAKKQIRELKTALRWKVPAAQRERIQMVLLREMRCCTIFGSTPPRDAPAHTASGNIG